MQLERVHAYVGEFLGTFMLVFSIGCNVLAGSRAWVATAIAATLTVLVYILGSVSGAHLNPAVSIAMGILKKLEWKEVAIYVALQILGGILAAACYAIFLWEVIVLKPAAGYSWWQAGVAELLYTCMLVFVILHVDGSVPSSSFGYGKPNPASGNQYFGLAIGFVLMAAIPAGGHISGGCFNPAVAIGLCFSSRLLFSTWWIVYALFEIVGAALAVVLFNLTNPLEEKNMDERGEPTTFAKCMSEFLGTFFLVLTVGLNVMGASIAPVYSIAAALMCMIFALGRVSGGHFNPAVSLAVVARQGGYMKPGEVLKYWAAQCVGGIAGAVVYTILERGRTFPLNVGSGFSFVHAGIAEILFTFLLCYVVLALTTTAQATTQFFGLAIASCVTAGGIAIGSISGGVLNPAVALGISVTSLLGGGSAWNFIPYLVFELLGAGFAAVVFRATRPEECLSK